MLSTDHLVTHIKEFRPSLRAGFMGSGLAHPYSPTTMEQKAWLALSHQLDIARLYLQLMTDDNFDQIVECEEQRADPNPW